MMKTGISGCYIGIQYTGNSENLFCMAEHVTLLI